MTKKIKLPEVDQRNKQKKKLLPVNGNAVKEKGFSFSFACFDRGHKLFNLGDHTPDGVVSGKWFLDLLDCFKNVSKKSITDLKHSMYDLHPITWEETNTKPPKYGEQYEYWQFRLNKSKGRVIGFIIDGIFYINWLDPHHNLTDSEGYGTIKKYKPGKSIYESQQEQIDYLQAKIKRLEGDLSAAEALLSDH